ncbi:pyochelin biosynthetic protein PchC [Streptomyces sp. BK208]|uniref:thioesterase II family protein n=1 Tax=Streptomyces sp. BK208 TaxID=2512150 RepID=UPI0010D1B14F|nr:alpha/beta fold hydrolase [Streptomyces sp. BK208]TDT42708.1 pyochelin biosynthetic protein PchC [Streptomyces sp. BK208]
MSTALGPVPRSGLRTLAVRAQSRARLVCFPHAGGGARAYRLWGVDAPWDVEVAAVQYPGREDRFAEPPATSMSELVDGIAAELVRAAPARPERATVLFGHSMGAAVAYETARRLSAAGCPPAALVVSGQPAPHRTRATALHLADDDRLLEEVRRLGGTASGVLDHDALLRALLPAIRADYRLIETYRPLPGRRLDAPVTVLYAHDDPEVDADEAHDWRETTAGPCDTEVFRGGHFYLEEQREAVFARVVARVRAVLPAAGTAWPSLP